MTRSQLMISPKGKLMAMIPHYQLIDKQLLFAFKDKEPLGTIDEIVCNGFFAIWLLRIGIIRKHYFEIKKELA